MNYLRFGVAGVVLLAAVALGYRWGAWRLESCRAEEAAIKQVGDEGKALSKDAQRLLDEKQAALEKASQAKTEALLRGFDAERAELKGQLTQANERLKEAQAKSAGNDADLARVRQQKLAATAAANAPLLKRLQDQERALVAMKSRLAQRQESLVCLQAPVPSEEVALLNRSAAAKAAGARP